MYIISVYLIKLQSFLCQLQANGIALSCPSTVLERIRRCMLSLSTTLRGPTEIAGFVPAIVLVATASGVDVPYVAAVTLLRRFSRHRHGYQAAGRASALYIKTAVEFFAGTTLEPN